MSVTPRRLLPLAVLLLAPLLGPMASPAIADDTGPKGTSAGGTDVSLPAPDQPRFTTLASSNTVAAGVDTDGAVWIWGDLARWDGAFDTPPAGPTDGFRYTPVPAERVDGVRFVDVEIGCAGCNSMNTIYALDDEGGLWAWGASRNGYELDPNVPTRIEFPAGVTLEQIEAGDGNSFIALDTEGRVWALPNAPSHEPDSGYSEITHVTEFDAKDISKIAAGGFWNSYYVVIETDGPTWMWGQPYFGEGGTFDFDPTPREIEPPAGETLVDVELADGNDYRDGSPSFTSATGNVWNYRLEWAGEYRPVWTEIDRFEGAGVRTFVVDNDPSLHQLNYTALAEDGRILYAPGDGPAVELEHDGPPIVEVATWGNLSGSMQINVLDEDGRLWWWDASADGARTIDPAPGAFVPVDDMFSVSEVLFGETPAASFEVIDGALRAITPAHEPATVDVTVRTVTAAGAAGPEYVYPAAYTFVAGDPTETPGPTASVLPSGSGSPAPTDEHAQTPGGLASTGGGEIGTWVLPAIVVLVLGGVALLAVRARRTQRDG